MDGLKQVFKPLIYGFFSLYALIRLKTLAKPSLIILTYHRIIPEHSPLRQYEQPGMIASPETLALHLGLFNRLGAEFVHLDDWLALRDSGSPLPRMAVAVTFDDGWRDNHTYAFPVLKAYGVPATIFLVSRLLNTQRVFWPEQIIYLLAQPPSELPEEVTRWLRPYCEGLPLGVRPLGISEADTVVNRLKSLDDTEILAKLDEIYGAFPTLDSGHKHRQILNTGELLEMQQSGLVRYGTHTRHHYRLNKITDPALLKDEIVHCIDDLQALDVGPATVFCYPNGDITNAGEQIVAEFYRGACTTRTGINHNSVSAYGLRRLNFHDGNGGSALLLLGTVGRSLV